MFYRLASLVVLSICYCGVMPSAGADGVWLDVPFVKQEKDGCGAASVAMVMQYWLKQQGRSDREIVDANEIHRAMSAQGGRGVYASAMKRYFEQHGFSAFPFRGEWNDLQDHLRKGRPLIVALKPSGADAIFALCGRSRVGLGSGDCIAERSRAAQAAQAVQVRL